MTAAVRNLPPSRLTHGLYSRHTVLPGEDQAAFDSLEQALLDDLCPVGPAETFYVRQMAAAQWRLQRVWSLETGAYEQFEQEHPDVVAESYPLRLARCFIADCQNGRALDRLSSHQMRLFNVFHKALGTLGKLQALRRGGFIPEDAHPVPRRRVSRRRVRSLAAMTGNAATTPCTDSPFGEFADGCGAPHAAEETRDPSPSPGSVPGLSVSADLSNPQPTAALSSDLASGKIADGECPEPPRAAPQRQTQPGLPAHDDGVNAMPREKAAHTMWARQPPPATGARSPP